MPSGDYDFLKVSTKARSKRLVRMARNKKEIRIPLAALQRVHLSLQRILIRLAIEKLAGSMRRLTFAHMTEIEDLIKNRPEGSIVHLPGQMKVWKWQGYLRLSLRNS